MSLSPEDLQEIISDFVVEATEMIEQLDLDIVALEKDTKNTDIINRIFRNLHTIKGTANFLNQDSIFAEMAKVAHAAEDVMGMFRDGNLEISSEIMDCILESIDAIKNLFSALESDGKGVTYSSLTKKLRYFLGEEVAEKEEQEKKEPLEVSQEQKKSEVDEEENITDLGLDEEDLKEIIQDFLVESKELLEQIDRNLVLLETDSANKELLNWVFRGLHTIKGTANFLNADPNFNKIAKIAHHAEDIIGEVREDKLILTTRIMDCILEAVDMIKDISSSIEHAEKFSGNIGDIVEKLTKVSQEEHSQDKNQKLYNEISKGVSEKSGLSSEDIEELIQDFLDESRELLEKLDHDFVELEKKIDDEKLIDRIFRYIHTFKGTTSFLGFKKISSLAHASEDVLKAIKDKKMRASSEVMDIILSAVDLMKSFFRKLEQGIKDEGDPVAIIISLEELIEKESKVEKPLKPVEKVKTPKKNQKIAQIEQTIRVETKRLDKLMNLVGELVLGRNRLSQVFRIMLDKISDDRLYQDLISAVDFIDFVTSDLQMAVLKTRMQPIGKIFNRFTRTVRDLARTSGKEVNLIIKGAETELDKSVIDELGDPLIHLLRNAVDHGIEFPDERRLAGKDKAGTIVLSAFHEGHHIIIDLRDDGKGIDPNIIRQKAIDKKLITVEESRLLPNKEILEFIFEAGFSTASEVTSLSGRGVGMDVVKNNIEKLNGSIDIHSHVGLGTTFQVRLPLTLAIIQALQVKVSSEIFSIPLASVMETIRIYHHQIQTISGKEVIQFRDTIIPIVRLDVLFDIDLHAKNREKIYVVIVEMAEKKVGLVVDKIIGQEEVVVKSLGKLLEDTTGISSACIGGDGKVNLILDIAGIFRLLPHSLNIFSNYNHIEEQTPEKGRQPSILIVEDSRSERKKTRMIIESRGFKGIEAIDGKDALAKLMEYQIDVVITDIEMPELNGYQLTSKIRENKNFRSIPVIAISSHKDMIDRIKGMEAGINKYLPKPFQVEELFTAIKNLLP